MSDCVFHAATATVISSQTAKRWVISVRGHLPDCADGGGTYIEINTADGKRFWYIDNNNRETPEYLHEFIGEVNEKINMLR